MDLKNKTIAAAVFAALTSCAAAFAYNGSYAPTERYSAAPSPVAYDDANEDYVDPGVTRQVGYMEPVVYATEQQAYAAESYQYQQPAYAGAYAAAPANGQYAMYADPAAAGAIEADKTIDEKFEELKKDFEALQKKVDKKTDKPDPSGKFATKVSGLFALGTTIVDQDDVHKAAYGDVNNGVYLRDARLVLKGEGYDVLNYECGFSFSNDFVFRNITVGMKKVPFFQNVKVGYFKAETDMNLQDAVIDTPAMYYNTNTMTYGVWRRIGVASTMYTEDKHVRWFNAIQTGKGWGNTASILDDEPGLILTSRLTATPIRVTDADDNLLEILHVGGSYMWVDPAGSADHNVTVRSRPTGWTGSMPYLLQATYGMGSKGYSVAEGEVAWQRGAFGIQSETIVGSFDRYGSTWGQELFIRWMLDPESYHTYADDRGCFGNVKLKHNAGRAKDSNAWGWDHYGVLEPFVMLSYADMGSMKSVKGSTYGDYFETIVGVNWWMCPQIKWAINYEHGKVNATNSNTGVESECASDTIGLQVNAAF